MDTDISVITKPPGEVQVLFCYMTATGEHEGPHMPDCPLYGQTSSESDKPPDHFDKQENLEKKEITIPRANENNRLSVNKTTKEHPSDSLNSAPKGKSLIENVQKKNFSPSRRKELPVKREKLESSSSSEDEEDSVANNLVEDHFARSLFLLEKNKNKVVSEKRQRKSNHSAENVRKVTKEEVFPVNGNRGPEAKTNVVVCKRDEAQEGYAVDVPALSIRSNGALLSAKLGNTKTARSQETLKEVKRVSSEEEVVPQKSGGIKNSEPRVDEPMGVSDTYLASEIDSHFSKSLRVLLPKPEGYDETRKEEDQQELDCEVCGISFTRHIDLAHHRRRQHRKPFICKTCGQGFRYRGHLTSHELIHSGEKPFKCRECGKAFRQSGTLLRHMRLHSDLGKPFKCPYCNMCFAQAYSRRVHMRSHPLHTNAGADVQLATECDLSDTDEKIRKLMKLFEANPHELGSPDDVRNGSAQDGNQLVDNAKSPIPSPSRYNGEMTQEQVPNNVTDNSHDILANAAQLNTCKNNPEKGCYKKGRTIGRRTDVLEVPLQGNDSDWESGIGKIKLPKLDPIDNDDESPALRFGSGFRNTDSKTRFPRNPVKGSEKSIDLKIDGVKCQEHSNEKKEAEADLQYRIGENQTNNREKTYEGNKRTTPKRLAAAPNVEILPAGDSEIASKAPPVFYVTKELASRSATGGRNRQVKKPFECLVCGVRFRYKSHLESHMLRHSGEKPFKCSYCDRTFRQVGTLVRHVRTHTRDRPCECQQGEFSLVNHVHEGETPFQCSECNVVFSISSDLLQHARTHSTERAIALALD